MNKKIALGCSALILASLVFGGTEVQDAQKKCQLFVEDNVPGISEAEGQTRHISILVSLFQKGELVRASDISSRSSGTNGVSWSGLEPGPNEIHFEARGYGKVVKRLALDSRTPARVIIEELGKVDLMLGAGPTLHDLEKRLAALEKKG